MLRYAKIIPYLKLPRGQNFFDYRVGDNLVGKIKVGDIVEVPFKNKKIFGLVYELTRQSEFGKLKTIDKVSSELSNDQFNFLKWFSDYYLYSPAKTWRLLWQPAPEKHHDIPKQKPSSHDLAVSPESKEKAIEIMNNDAKGFLINTINHVLKFQIYSALCEQAIKTKQTVCLIFPNKEVVRKFHFTLKPEIFQQTAVLTGDIKKKKNLNHYLQKKIQNNEIRVVIGTRSVVFAPFNDLDYIVIDQSQDEDHKNRDQTPVYSAVDCAEKLAELHKAKLLLCSTCPPVEQVHRAQRNNYKLTSWGEAIKPELKILKLDQVLKNEKSPIAQEIFDHTQTVLANKRKVLIIVNKKNAYGMMLCADCGHVFKCEKCNIPFAVDEENRLLCANCKTSQDSPAECPLCRGVNLKKVGIGLGGIKELFEKKFGKKKNLLFSTGQNLRDEDSREIDFTAVIYADGLLYLSDYNANHKLYTYFRELINCLTVNNPAVKFIIQTSFADNHLFSSLNKDYNHFYKKELADRRRFNYPPFTQALKIMVDFEDEQKAFSSAKSLGLKLKNNFPECKISPAYAYYKKMVRGRFRYNVLIFCKHETENKLRQYLRGLPAEFKIDINPVNVL